MSIIHHLQGLIDAIELIEIYWQLLPGSLSFDIELYKASEANAFLDEMIFHYATITSKFLLHRRSTCNCPVRVQFC